MTNKVKKLINDFGLKDYSITKLQGDGSDRVIFRIKKSNNKSYIAIYGNLIPENRAFLEFRKTFENNSLNVPKLYAVSNDETAYLLEDLGDQTINIVCNKYLKNEQIDKIEELYLQIILNLPKIQIDLKDKINYKYCYQHANFDYANIIYDVSRFKTYFLKSTLNFDYDISKFDQVLNNFALKTLDSNNIFFVYRDFQPRNIMLHDKALFFIDFQSGRKGSLFYDLASFLYDSDTYMNEKIEDNLVNTYINQLKNSYNLIFDKDKFKQKLYHFGIIRLFQAIGAYGYLSKCKNKLIYKQKIPAAFSTLIMLFERLQNKDFFTKNEIEIILNKITS